MVILNLSWSPPPFCIRQSPKFLFMVILNFPWALLSFVKANLKKISLKFTSEFETKSGVGSTGKSMSEALIFDSVNPQYDKRLFIESPKKYKLRTCCVQKLCFFF